MVAPREGRWTRPGDGLIGGEIINIGTNEFSIKSFDGEEWKIVYNDRTEKNNPSEFSVGDKVGIIGKKNNDFSISAFSIRTFPEDWDGKNPRNQRFNRQGKNNPEHLPPPENFSPFEKMHP